MTTTFFVSTNITTERGTIWFPFQVEGVPTLKDFARIVTEDGLILGHRVSLTKRLTPDADRGVLGRSEYLLGKAAISAVRLPDFSVPGPHGWTATPLK